MKYKIPVIRGTRNPVDLDLIVTGLYSKSKPTLYHKDKTFDELKSDIIDYQRNISTSAFFFDIIDKLKTNIDKVELIDVELIFPNDDINFQLFNLEVDFNIPEIGLAPINSKFIFMGDKVYFKNGEYEKVRSYPTVLTKEFILLNPKIFKPI